MDLPFPFMQVYLVLHGKGDKTDNRMKTGTTGTTGNMRQRTWEATNSLSSQGLCVKHEEKPLNQVDIQVLDTRGFPGRQQGKSPDHHHWQVIFIMRGKLRQVNQYTKSIRWVHPNQ